MWIKNVYFLWSREDCKETGDPNHESKGREWAYVWHLTPLEKCKPRAWSECVCLWGGNRWLVKTRLVIGHKPSAYFTRWRPKFLRPLHFRAAHSQSLAISSSPNSLRQAPPSLSPPHKISFFTSHSLHLIWLLLQSRSPFFLPILLPVGLYSQQHNSSTEWTLYWLSLFY